MKDFIQVIILVIAILLALVLLRQCEGPQYPVELTAIPLPARTVTQEPSPLPTLTPVPTVYVSPADTPIPRPTATPRPIKLGKGKGVISGHLRHYRHGTRYIDPYEGANVALFYKGQKAKQVKTDRAGVFRISGLPTGVYDLRVFVMSAYPYDKTRGIEVEDGRETAGVSILLEQEFVPDEMNLTFKRGVGEAQARQAIRQHGLTLVKRDPENGDYLVKVSPGKYVPDMLEEMREDEQVRDAVPNYYVYYHD